MACCRAVPHLSGGVFILPGQHAQQPAQEKKISGHKKPPAAVPLQGAAAGGIFSGFGVSKQRVQNKLLVLRQMPLPVDDLRQILANFVDVVLMSNQLVVHLLDQISALVAQLRQVLQGILNQVEAVDLVLHAHIERRGDGAFLLVAMDRQVALVRS